MVRAIHICHVTENHSPANPGVTAVVNKISKYLVNNKHRASVLTISDSETVVPKAVELKKFPASPVFRIWRYSPSISHYLKNLSTNKKTVFHLHGVWFGPQWVAARNAIRNNIPTILSPHGMLEPWQWQKSLVKIIKKMIYWKVFAYPVFRHMKMIHAVSALEKGNLARLFPTKRIELIPNAIDLKEADEQLNCYEEDTLYADRPYILFLGRLDAQKGLDILIDAFALLTDKKMFRLLIVGPESDPKYSGNLKTKVRNMGLEQDIIFVGPVFGAKKWDFYRNAWAFCVPSRSEGLSSVQLEAAAAKVPIITSYSAGFPELQGHGGILINPEVVELSSLLEDIISWSFNERTKRGKQLRSLVERRFSIDAVGSVWIALYNELLGVSHRI